MRITFRSEWPHLLLLTAQFVLAGLTWGAAPDRIAVHWGLDGQVDRYGGRFEGILMLPLVSLLVYLLMLWLPRLDPGRANYEAFAGAYTTIRLAVLAVLAATYGIVQLAIHGREVSIQTALPLLVGAMCVVLGGVLGKVRPNWFVGIRTPWTLSSKQSWARTHRAGGWLFIALGVLIMGAALLRMPWAPWVMVASLVAGAAGLVIYSYVVWRSDPEKLPPGGTLPAGNG
ncbi:MAG TPA: SdpI family protein [Candidatus Eisenbacteria bacterium]|jgi:uncharacterized membrane protein